MSFIEVTLRLLNGFAVTCELFALTLLFALPLGLIISFGSMSKLKPVRAVVKAFVWVIRGVPLMLQVFLVFYILPTFIPFAVFDRFPSALIAFVINYACYFSEIYRAGIEAIPIGQTEAGLVLGMTKSQIFTRVTLQQVIKRIIPPMGNEIITLVKDTALSRIIMVNEIFKVAEELQMTERIIWPIFYTAVFYLIFVGALTLLFGYLEKKQSYYKI